MQQVKFCEDREGSRGMRRILPMLIALIGALA